MNYAKHNLDKLVLEAWMGWQDVEWLEEEITAEAKVVYGWYGFHSIQYELLHISFMESLDQAMTLLPSNKPFKLERTADKNWIALIDNRKQGRGTTPQEAIIRATLGI